MEMQLVKQNLVRSNLGQEQREETPTRGSGANVYGKTCTVLPHKAEDFKRMATDLAPSAHNFEFFRCFVVNGRRVQDGKKFRAQGNLYQSELVGRFLHSKGSVALLVLAVSLCPTACDGDRGYVEYCRKDMKLIEFADIENLVPMVFSLGRRDRQYYREYVREHFSLERFPGVISDVSDITRTLCTLSNLLPDEVKRVTCRPQSPMRKFSKHTPLLSGLLNKELMARWDSETSRRSGGASANRSDSEQRQPMDRVLDSGEASANRSDSEQRQPMDHVLDSGEARADQSVSDERRHLIMQFNLSWSQNVRVRGGTVMSCAADTALFLLFAAGARGQCGCTACGLAMELVHTIRYGACERARVTILDALAPIAFRERPLVNVIDLLGLLQCSEGNHFSHGRCRTKWPGVGITENFAESVLFRSQTGCVPTCESLAMLKSQSVESKCYALRGVVCLDNMHYMAFVRLGGVWYLYDGLTDPHPRSATVEDARAYLSLAVAALYVCTDDPHSVIPDQVLASCCAVGSFPQESLPRRVLTDERLAKILQVRLHNIGESCSLNVCLRILGMLPRVHRVDKCLTSACMGCTLLSVLDDIQQGSCPETGYRRLASQLPCSYGSVGDVLDACWNWSESTECTELREMLQNAVLRVCSWNECDRCRATDEPVEVPLMVLPGERNPGDLVSGVRTKMDRKCGGCGGHLLSVLRFKWSQVPAVLLVDSSFRDCSFSWGPRDQSSCTFCRIAFVARVPLQRSDGFHFVFVVPRDDSFLLYDDYSYTCIPRTSRAGCELWENAHIFVFALDSPEVIDFRSVNNQ